MGPYEIALCCELEIIRVGKIDPMDFIHDIVRSIRYSPDEDNVKVGQFHVYHIDISRGVNEREFILDILDSHSAEVPEYLELFDRRGRLLRRRFAIPFAIPSRILKGRSSHPQSHRGSSRAESHGIALLAKRRLMQRYWEGAALAAGNAFPPQFEYRRPNGVRASGRGDP
jgi:hypothetical protein